MKGVYSHRCTIRFFHTRAWSARATGRCRSSPVASKSSVEEQTPVGLLDFTFTSGHLPNCPVFSRHFIRSLP